MSNYLINEYAAEIERFDASSKDYDDYMRLIKFIKKEDRSKQSLKLNESSVSAIIRYIISRRRQRKIESLTK